MISAERLAGLVVVKVGGSLYDLPDLGPRLRGWLKGLGGGPVLLVPGGGPAADVVRELDRHHGLGEEAAHWLALRAMSLNADFLRVLLPEARVVAHPSATAAVRLAVLDAHAFGRADEGAPGCLPHSWEVTSDALAARAAVVGGAERLVLLKSVTIPADVEWEEAARRSLVDGWFPHVLRQAPGLRVDAVDFRRALNSAGQPARAPSER